MGVFACLAVSCTASVDHGATVYSCVEDPTCPSGYDCIEGTCVKLDPSADAGVDAAPTELVRADLLYYSFDTDELPTLAHDRSGNRFDGEIRGAEFVDGRFGRSLQFEEGDEIQVRDSAKLYSGSTITIEAYVLHLVGQELAAIYGDDDVNAEPDSVEYALAIDTQDRLEFKTNAGCGEGIVTYTSDQVVETVGWHHVAVTWDGSTITFYIDGALSGQATNANVPCESLNPRSYRIGRLRNGAGEFTGLIDEVKVSGVAKTALDIQASMVYDASVGDLAHCGDNLIETEACEPANSCCTASCELAAADTVCSQDGACNALGACLREGGRVTADLSALYEFNEELGATVTDTSGVGDPLNLTIANELAVTWGGGALQVNEPVEITSPVSAEKIETAVEQSDEVTIEVWVNNQPAQDGTPRIFSYAASSGTRNANLAMLDASYYSNIRTSANSAGNPLIDSPAGDVSSGVLTHLLVTRSVDGTRRFYIDGVLRSRNVLEGNFDNWNSYLLTLANATGGGQPWLGSLHLVAVYSRALTSAEVAQNFAAGAD
jgi:hypothetical protein